MSRTVEASSEGRGPRAELLGAQGSALGALSAVLYVLSFPNFNLSILAWIALAPLIYVSVHQTPKRAFFLGWVSGTLAYMGILYWVIVTFLAAKQSIVLSALCLFLLSAYLGLYWGVWTAWMAWTAGNLTPDPSPDRRGELSVKTLSYQERGDPPIGGWVRFSPLSAAAAWTALEFLRTYLFSGFPWTLLGDSQWPHLFLIQIASVTGVYGVSFLVVLINGTIVQMVRAYSGIRTRLQRLVALALLGGCLIYGVNRLHAYDVEPHQAGRRVALLQGSIDQYAKWDTHYVDAIERTYERLNAQAAQQKPDLIIWPETSVPGYLLQDPDLRVWLSRVIQRTGTSHVVGAPSLMADKTAYNSAFSLDPAGQITGQYDKQHLVPFGEVVPWSNLLGRWIRVLNDLGGFTSGQRSPVLNSGIGPIGVNICYEAIFPNLVRQAVMNGAGAIVNLTNDGWYMRTAAPYQHFIPNVFRAVENKRWVLRADNTGISCLISPVGRVQAASTLFVPTVVSGSIVPRQDITFYTRYGDVFAWGCLLFCILFSVRAILRRP